MLESDFEKKVVDWADSIGGVAVKLKEDNKRGFPDRTILLPDARIVFAELKRPSKSKKYHQQKVWIERLQELGFAAGFFDNLEDIEGLL